MTYVVLSAGFLAVAALIAGGALVIHRRTGGPADFSWQAVAIATAVLLLLTAVFDNVIIGVGLVDYSEEHISGVRLGVAPIEDFSYSIAAVLLLPALWVLLGRVQTRRRADAH
ncbi:lycopene cyclase domain-containing protein [Nesterenkonia natronophila]|uniref:Lycopene cyclase domain-containing protein n=1 Tax=Nesterenkonia natronophila TaxID=2174932 RepID=A0A3A4F070_9MICC|nr:lycopene cyclase domain-containing protein [Nesterenkonia natronophila]RJN31562.1 lycopene cyclase domain-containing protein [Nesterenkonia natronophila]